MRKDKNVNAKISTILGKGCVLNGDFNADGSARTDGTVNGNVVVRGTLILGVGGKINGDLQTAGALIGGEVIGNIDAPEKLEISSGARVFGDVKTKIIVIDEHAIFQGKCDMYQEAPTSKKAVVKPSVKVTRAGKKSAKAAIVEALKEVEEENFNQEDNQVAVEKELKTVEKKAEAVVADKETVEINPTIETKEK